MVVDDEGSCPECLRKILWGDYMKGSLDGDGHAGSQS
jgi:hypothetical protein